MENNEMKAKVKAALQRAKDDLVVLEIWADVEELLGENEENKFADGVPEKMREKLRELIHYNRHIRPFDSTTIPNEERLKKTIEVVRRAQIEHEEGRR